MIEVGHGIFLRALDQIDLIRVQLSSLIFNLIQPYKHCWNIQ